MPAHDWTRVNDGVFHDFHQGWVVAIRDALNDGRMPPGFYAMAEQIAAGPKPDVIALKASKFDDGGFDTDRQNEGGIAVLDHPPKVRFTADEERDIYAESADRVTVRHSSADRIVAFIEILSSGNKNRPYMLQKFVERLNDALHDGIHLLLIDVHPPGKHDPHGIHAALWELRSEASHGVTAEEPLGFSSYRCNAGARAYFERISIGQPLPDMPVFLTPTRYVYVPLETAYTEAYRGVPERWKRVIEGREGKPA